MTTRWKAIAAVLTLAALAAVPAAAEKPATAGECIQTGRGAVYHTITNDRYRCQIDGNRLMLFESGRKVAAPEGTYRNLPDGRNCLVGKGGHILSCSRQ